MKGPHMNVNFVGKTADYTAYAKRIYEVWKSGQSSASKSSSSSAAPTETCKVMMKLDESLKAKAKANMVKTRLSMQMRKTARLQKSTIDLARKDSNA